MKKTFIGAMVAAAMLGTIPAMAAETETETAETEILETADEEEQAPMLGGGGILGGWQIEKAADITKEHEELIQKALEGRAGTKLTPVALLASQVVAGRNYCFLCLYEYAPANTPCYSLVYIYEDLNGGADITAIAPLDLVGLLENNTRQQQNFEDADYLYIDYDFMTEDIVNSYYLIPIDGQNAYSCMAVDSTSQKTVTAGTAKEMLDAAFTSADGANCLPVEGGKGAIIWRTEDGLKAYVRNYRDYNDVYTEGEDGEGQMTEIDMSLLDYVQDEAEIEDLLERFGESAGEKIAIPVSDKTE